MAESAISFLFDQLSIWLQEEQQLLAGFKEEAELIHGEMGQMMAFLRVADAKEESDPQLKVWVSQVREIAYDAEDILERHMLRFSHHGAHGFRDNIKKIYVSVKNLKARHQIASEIKAIKSRLENASKRQQTFRDIYPIMNQGSSSTPAWYDGRGDALRLEEVDIVGIEKPKEKLLTWLSSIESGLKVISVVGMAGLGKTTLVKKVFDDTSVKMNFDHQTWITVSESFKIENLLQDMIKRLLEDAKQPPAQGLEAMNADDMREFIYNFLQNKDYIIVLDDIWTTNAWEAIRYAFPSSTSHGRGCIIITTRFNNIGNAACCESNGHVYKLAPLPEEKSRKLFYRKAFLGNPCPPYLEEISKSILKRCEGLPLAIVVIGGLLATKNNKIEEWEMFYRSVGSELEGDHLKRISKLLSLSFYDLPYYLKACFLYLSIFPKDELINKAVIIRLWTAEGFVEAKQGKTMEEIAEGYMNELLNRSLIRVAQTCYDGRPRNFHIHDLVREYIISKAREQNIAVVDSQGEIQRPDSIRRLALDGLSNPTQQIYKGKYLRSLLLSSPANSEWGPILYDVLRGGCKMLKVLELRRAPIDAIPDEVFKLYHLKYLGLRDTRVKIIPKAIGNLGKLETLDLKRCRVTELPIEILKLQRLRNLLLYAYAFDSGYHKEIRGFKAPYEMGRLLCLQKLCYIDLADARGDQIKIVREIGKLTQLRRLGITKLRRENGKELCSSLARLTNLRSLNIESFNEEEYIDLEYPLSPSTFPFLRCIALRGRLERMPQWICSFNAVSRLLLGWSRLQGDPLEYLQGLPNLVDLTLHSHSYEGQELSFNAGGFQRLVKLCLARLRGLRWVRVEKGSMPLLDHVTISDCESMVEMPVGIEHLKDLKIVRFTDMAEEFVERLVDEKRKEGDQWRLTHVRLIVVYNWVNGKSVRRQL
ncbi:Apoptotic ATPase [Handroanthus impetiginosus]|uniref:Apoptotic ATPase n=1 Tax=Handroanthus impetiginosus TaxID=429701 RepID=A0A2G9GPV7_9LAMI|nr:Apoptotic ATPase [Handroanthus impetiginosus]